MQNLWKSLYHIANSILIGTRKPFITWKKYIECTLNTFFIRKSARICNIQITTVFVWRHEIFDALATKLNKETSLKGIVGSDETFFTIFYKGSKYFSIKIKCRGAKATKQRLSDE